MVSGGVVLDSVLLLR